MILSKYANLSDSKVKSDSIFILTIRPHIVQNIIKPIYFITCKSNEFSKNQFVWREGNSKDEFKKKKECNVEGKITVVQFYCAVTINYAWVYTDPIYQQQMV